MGDVVAFQSATCLIGGILFHQLALATHGFLAVFIRMVKVGQVDADTQDTCCHQYTCRLPKGGQCLLLVGLYPIGYRHEQHHEQEVIAHLHVVGRNLQRHKEGSYESAPQVLATITKHHSRNGRRYVGQGNEFPDMSGSNDDEEVGREGPDNGAQSCHPHLEVECTEQDIESQQHHKHIPDISRQVQVIEILDALQPVGRVVAGCHLVRRHPAEDGVCPTGPFTGPLQVFLSFLSGTDARYRVVLGKNTSFGNRRTEVSERDNRKHYDGDDIGENSLECIHNLKSFYIQRAKIR